MGKGFGNLTYVRNQIWFSLSPYEQKPFAKAIKSGLPNVIRRFSEEAPYVLPPMLFAYAVYSWTVTTAAKMKRKEFGGGHH